MADFAVQKRGYAERSGFTVSAVLAAVFLVLSACASHPHKIKAEPVSSARYEDYDCDAIGSELERISKAMTRLYWSLEAEADADDAQFVSGVFIVIPWFWLEGGDGIDAVEYSRLKGEFIALKDVAIKKQCDPGIIPPDPEDQIKGEVPQNGKESKDSVEPTEEELY